MTERLWRDVHERLTAFVARRVDEPADVADIVQTVFLRVQVHAATVRDEQQLLPWLFRVTRNAIADHYRSPARRLERTLDDATGDGDDRAVEDATAAPIETEALTELAACVRPMLERLSPLHQEALRLVEFEGRSQVDAARDLGVSVSGMKSRVQRGRAELRELLLACCEVSRSATGGVLEVAPRHPASCSCGAC